MEHHFSKPPGLSADLSKVAMRFRYEDAFGKSSANGYERLLLDAMLGDATLFSHRDGSWGPRNAAIPLSDEVLGPDL
jgi:glucose-6-phosphate 1-dehydrogenase